MSPRRSEVEATAMVVENTNLARAAVKGFCRAGVEYADNLQVALIGLYKAALTWDANNGSAFTTYAWKIMRRDLSHHLSRETAVATLGYRATQLRPEMRQAANHLSLAKGEEPTLEEIAAFMGMESRELRLVIGAVAPPVYLGTPSMSKHGEGAAFVELIQEETQWQDVRPNLREDMIRAVDESGLTPRQAEAIKLTYLSGNRQSQATVAETMGVTRQRVRTLIDKATARLRDTYGLDDFGGQS